MTLTVSDQLRRFLRSIAPRNAYLALSESLDALYGVSRLGWNGYRHLRSLMSGGGVSGQRLEAVTPSTLAHPIYIRPGSSDAQEIVHTAVRQVYAHWLPRRPVEVVVDAGAYIGDTTAWYLTRFPEARVIAVEPDPENFELLQTNCKPYGERANLVQAALWSKETTLHLQAASKRDAVTVSDGGGHFACRGVSLTTLMQMYDLAAIDLLKCDIEGAEVEVFSEGCDEWLSRTRCMVVETHGDICLQVVNRAARRHGFSHRPFRFLHFFHR